MDISLRVIPAKAVTPFMKAYAQRFCDLGDGLHIVQGSAPFRCLL
jgi:hypothetical protein